MTHSILKIYTLSALFMTALSLHGQNLLDEQGLKTGPWKVEYPNGMTRYEVTFLEGKPVGEMIRYDENGAILARMMFDSLEERSYTRLYYKNGVLAAEGWHVRQLKDSVWTYYSEFDGTIRIREPYVAGSLQGMARKYYSSGGVSEEVNWDKHLKSGPWRQYYQEGSLRLESSYENDQLNGAYEVFYADSTIQVRGNYLDNLSEGTWRFYDETGTEAYTLEFRHGVAVDQEKYQQIMQDSLKRFEMLREPDPQEQF